MKDTDILFSIALMILGIVLMYKSMKGNSCRQRLAKLADSIASDKENINFQIKMFGYLWTKWLPIMKKFNTEVSCRQTGGTCHAIGPHTKRT